MDLDTFEFFLMFTALVGFSICILFIMKSYTEPKEPPVTDEEPSSNTKEGSIVSCKGCPNEGTANCAWIRGLCWDD